MINIFTPFMRRRVLKSSNYAWREIRYKGLNLDSEVATWAFDSVRAAGGTFSMIDIMALNKYVKRGKNFGWWSKKKVVWIPAGDQFAASIVPLKTSGYTFANNGMTTYARNVGVTKHTTGIYVNMGIKPSDIGTVIMHVGCYTTTTLDDNTVPIGCSDASATNRCRIDTVTTAIWRAFQGGGLANGASASSDANRKGRFISNRTTLSRLDLWQNGSSIANNTTALTDTQASVVIYGFSENANGTSSGGITNKSLGELSVGTSLTNDECVDESSALERCMLDLGRSAL